MEFSNNSAITTFDEFEKFTNVTSLRDNAFKNCANLSSIKLPSSVSSINSYAFHSSPINSLNFENITHIGNYVFIGSKLSQDVHLNKLKTLGVQAFYDSGIISVDAPLVISLSHNVFGGNNNLKFVKIGDLCKTTEGSLFTNNPIIEYVEFGEGITTLGGNLFGDCKNTLKHFLCKAITPPSLGTSAFENTNNCPIYVPNASVEAYKTATNWTAYADRIMSMFYYLGYIDFADPAVRDICVANFDTDADGVVSMEEAAAVTDIGTIFNGNTEITSFDEFKYFTGVTTLANNSFRCPNLVSVILPDSITTANNGWANTSKITSINIPQALANAGYGAFGISTLEKVDIGNSSLNFTGDMFGGASSLVEFVVPSTNLSYQSIEGVLYSKDSKTLHLYPTGLKEWKFADGVEKINDLSRNSVNKVDVFTPPSSVKTFNSPQWINTRKLVIPETVEVLAGYYGGNNSSHEIIDITPNEKLVILGYGFVGANVTSFVIRKSVIPQIQTIFAMNGTCSIYVPDDAIDNFKADSNWSSLADRIKPLSEYVEE